MARCPDVDPLITPYVDGETPALERRRLEAHLDECLPCAKNAAAERTARELLQARASTLIEPAPPALRERCSKSARTGAGPLSARWGRALRARWPMALAATLVLAVGSALLYAWVLQPVEAVAAQLTLDHLKCFALFDQPKGMEPAEVQASLKARFGMDIAVPTGEAACGLTLVGGRRCMYLDGAVAHLLYKRNDVPVSVFVLPSGSRFDTSMRVMGHAAAFVQRDGRTLVVVARLPQAEVTAMAEAWGRAAR